MRAHLLGGAAHHHGEAVPLQQPEHQDHDPQRAADQGHHGERDQDHRQRQAGGDDEGHGHVDACRRNSRRAGPCVVPIRPEMSDDADADQQRDARAVDAGGTGSRGRAGRCRAGAASCPSRTRPAGSVRLRQVLHVGVVRREQRREARRRARSGRAAGADQEGRAGRQARAAGRGGAARARLRRAGSARLISGHPDARIEPRIGDVGGQRQQHVDRRTAAGRSPASPGSPCSVMLW